MSALLSKRLPPVILLIYTLLAAAYSLATPIFEAPDENYHFAMIQRLAQSWDLPIQNPAVKTPWFQEGSQPPPYYYLASIIARAVAGTGDPFTLPINPHAQVGIGLAPINRNFFVHSPAEAIPGSGPILALRLVRLLSIALGAWTLIAVYQTAKLAAPQMPAAAPLAMAFTAFNPMFLFLNASVNNDNLVAALGATASWLALLVLRGGFTWRRWALLAAVLALASLSKISGLTLYAVAFGLLVILASRRRLPLRRALLAALVLGVAWALLAGWWYLRNLQLYGDLTGLNAMIAIIEPRQAPYTFGTLLAEMEGLRISFWALFGWLNVIGPPWFLLIMDILTGLALFGGVIWTVREIRAWRWESLWAVGLLGGHLLVTFVGLVNWTRLTPGTQGRLLFPAIAAISTLMAFGWLTVTRFVVPTQKGVLPDAPTGTLSRSASPSPPAERGHGGEVLALLPILIMLLVAALTPFLIIAPAYARPPTVSALPADTVPVDVIFGKVQVTGFRIDPTPVLPGGNLPITLYLRGAPDPRDLSLYLTVFDGAGQPVGKIDSYPGGGNLPTSVWTSGQLYADTYSIPISPTARGPAQFSVEFGWWDFATKTRIPSTGADGSPLAALILRGGTLLATAPATPPMVAQSAVFSGALRLNGYALAPADGALRAGETLQVTLNWEGLTHVYEDFTVFLHLETEDGKLVTQDDSPPLRGVYPTSAWAPGQPFSETRQIQIALGKVPPGTYRLALGLYRPDDLSRLPVDSGGDTLILRTKVQVKG